ncbi:MAG: ATP-dependent zinc protease [Candidatus Bipolaricaulia bacterium]
MARRRTRDRAFLNAADRPVIGWREWAGLPEFGVPRIKAKVDTGARTSAIHAKRIQRFHERGRAMVQFVIHPVQRSTRHPVTVTAEITDERKVRSSSGRARHRPVIVTPVKLANYTWAIEVTLANRDMMGFRLLLGRQALKQRFLVHPGRSFVTSPDT